VPEEVRKEKSEKEESAMVNEMPGRESQEKLKESGAMFVMARLEGGD
jgi:hypothetical protein